MPSEIKPARLLPKNHRPVNSIPRRVRDGDDWARIAAQCGMSVNELIEFNFDTTDPYEVNYYLRVNVGCKKPTRDGNNWMFSSADKPGLIYLPKIWVRMAVPHFQGTLANSCWHDAARMIYQYKKKADIHPLAAEWRADAGLSPNTFIRLAKQVGMRPIQEPPFSFDVQHLADLLTKYGPLWAAGTWNGVNHIIVVTGVDSNGNVYVNDPARPTPRTENISWFNSRLYRTDQVDNPLLYLP